MRKYNISANLVRTIGQLLDKATSAVQMNGSMRERFRTTVELRQRYLLSPTPFNIFFKRIISNAPEENNGKVSIGGRNIINLRFVDDKDALAEEEKELEALVESLDKICTRNRMEFSAEKTKRMKTGQWHPKRDKGKRAKAGYCNKLQLHAAVVSDDGSKPEILSRITQAT